MMWKRRLPAACVAGLLLAGCTGGAGDPSTDEAQMNAAAATMNGLRLTGTVEAVRTRSVPAPRLRGTPSLMIITYLIPAGTRVEPGDLLVAFDRQEQERLAFDARAELTDFESQIAKKIADQAAEEAKDQTAIVAARNDVARAGLAITTNDLIAPVDAEKNTLSHEQATAQLAQLEKTFALKRKAAAADLEILNIRRERAARSLEHAESNAELMEIRAPFSGLVVIKTTFRGTTGAEPILEGDEVRAGQGIVDIVDTDVMQVRARANQADASRVQAGQPAIVRLDGFPDLAFEGRVENVSPLLTPSSRADDVRSLVVVVSINGNHEQLLPDLTASVELAPETATMAARDDVPGSDR